MLSSQGYSLSLGCFLKNDQKQELANFVKSEIVNIFHFGAMWSLSQLLSSVIMMLSSTEHMKLMGGSVSKSLCTMPGSAQCDLWL